MSSESSRSWFALVREALVGTQRSLVELPMREAIVLLAVPMILEMFMESVFAICDVFFVAKIGAAAVATVGFCESLMMMVYAVAIGLSMSTTAIVARRWGEGDKENAAKGGAQALLLGGGVGIVAGLVGAVFAPELLALMGAEAEVIAVGSNYARIALAGNVVVVTIFLANAIFRGVGDAAGAMRALWVANAINIVLDPCLIFGLGPFPELGLTGAAVATLIGRSLGVVYQLTRLSRGPSLRLQASAWVVDLRAMLNLLRVSLGGIGQQVISMASWVLLVRIVAEFGSDALAGYTISVRILLFVILPSWGLSNAAATLVGQNLGAGHPERAEAAVWTIGRYNMVFLGLVSVAFIFVPEPFIAFFSDDPEVLRHGTDGLRIVAYGYMFYAWEMVMVQAFNGAGDTLTPTAINFGCFWLFQIGFAWFLAHSMGMGPQGVFWAVAVGYSLAAVVALILFRRGYWKKKKV